MVQQVQQEKEMIGHISFDDIIPSLFLNGKDISSFIFSVQIVNLDSFSPSLILLET
jgi:hypothetical protein